MKKVSVLRQFAATWGLNKDHKEKLVAYSDLALALGLKLWLREGGGYQVTTLRSGGAMIGRHLCFLE